MKYFNLTCPATFLGVMTLQLFLSHLALGQDQKLLAKGKAGDVEIGMSAGEVYGFFAFEDVRLFNQFLEGTFSPALLIEKEGLIAELECDKVYRIQVSSVLFHTEDGLHVGMSLEKLIGLYPKAEFLHGEASYIVFVPSLSMSFTIGLEGLDEEKVNNNDYRELSDFPGSTRINRILIF